MDIEFDASLIPESEDQPTSIGELTWRIKNLLEMEFAGVWVVGQVSDFKHHNSGHLYFTLKDDRAQIRCVMWRSSAERISREITDGLEVEARGHVSVYEKWGQYQLYVSSLKPRGVGALEVAFRKLKEKLAEEGLFEAEHKKELPRFPRRVGVVTSPTGAAIRDIGHVLTRRWPGGRIILAPARVQGDGAAPEIVRGIEWLNRLGDIDVMVVGRGGGSLEDLWPFNEESVARAIFASEVPVVSAVGHETDFSISDFVADVRAPTPSAAAEIVVPDCEEIRAGLERQMERLARHLEHRLARLGDRLALSARSRFMQHPEDLVLVRAQHVEDLAARLAAGTREAAGRRRLRLERLGGRLARVAPKVTWQEAAGSVRMAVHRLRAAGRELVARRRQRLDRLGGRLDDLNPDRVLARGYSRTKRARDGTTLRRAADVKPGERLRTVLAEGELSSRVETEEGTDEQGTLFE